MSAQTNLPDTGYSHSAETEAQFQNDFIAGVFGQRSQVPGIVSGDDPARFEAYCNNGEMNAVRAISVMFPAVSTLLGNDDFHALARLHWRDCPPKKGDWSHYGDDFSSWIGAKNPGGVLTALPFLADLASLDLSLSRCQDSLDASSDLSTVSLLDQDPNTLRMRLHPSVSVLTLSFDVTAFRQAVLNQEPLTEPKAQLNHLVIARKDWRAQAYGIDAAGATLMQHCLQGDTLMSAHQAACALDEQFDFGTWLNHAIQNQWLIEVHIEAPMQPQQKPQTPANG